MMGQDSITRTGARAPGVKQRSLLEWRCSTEQVTPDTVRRVHAAAENTKDGGKPDLATGMLGASLTAARSGKALSDMPALEPYRGKPAVRNLRGDDGNVGIIRSPVRAIVLPDREPTATGATKLPTLPTVTKDQLGLLVTRSFVYGRIPCRRIPHGHGPPPR